MSQSPKHKNAMITTTMAANPHHNDEPLYDEDDLINDYMEDEDFGPPPDYDDLVEEMMEDHAGNFPTNTNARTDAGDAGVAAVQINANDDVMEIPSRIEAQYKVNEQDIDVIMEGQNEGPIRVPNEVTIDNIVEEGEVNQLSSGRNKDNQLYSFERYSNRYAWRNKSSRLEREEQDLMAATAWKQKFTIEKNNRQSGGMRQKTNAPESQLVQFLSEKITKGTTTGSKSLSRDRFQMLSTLPVEDEESSPVTVGGGKMFYVPKVKSDIKYLRCDKMGLTASSDGATDNLLGISMSELTKRAEIIERKNDRRKRFRTRDKESNEVRNMNHSEEEKKYESEDDKIDFDSFSSNNKKRSGRESQLWVDKYAPMSFTDLLSDERTNREVLRALRQWDPFVFQREPPPRPRSDVNNDKTESQSGPDSKGTEKSEHNVPNKNDPRPDEQNRVILLSGAPGVGKTTLAHIVARHAGYRPMEVNASDERSTSVLTERVTRAMESSTLNLMQLDKKDDDLAGRPNCLILDEIDGADAKSSIAALVEIIRAEKPVKGAKSKGKKTYLRRPIIFICNHKFAPALRPLLPYARQFDVLPPSPNRLVSRLKAVLTEERMTLVSGSGLFRQLVGVSGGDIRSCLYTLQFAAARARELSIKRRNNGSIDPDYHHSVVDIAPVLNIALNGNGRGMKDLRSDMTGTLRTIFRKLKQKKILGSKGSISTRDVERVLNVVETFSDSSKTLDGLFLNLLNVSYIDPTLDRCWTAHEWLSSVDVYRSQKSPLASNNYAEHRAIQSFHIPSAAAAVHVLCRVETNPTLTFSLRPLLDSVYQHESNNGLINKFFDGLNPKSRSGVSSSGFTSEILPFCLRLLSAGVGNGALDRAVSSIDILTKEEKATFNAHVEMLRALGLTYKKVEDGQPDANSMSNEIEMRFEPEIDRVFQFQGLKKSVTQRNIPPALKELLAHAASIANLRQKEQLPSQEKNTLSSSLVVEPSSEVTGAGPTATIAQKTKIGGAHDKKSLKKNVKAEMNFLGIGAARAKAARSARKAAQVGYGKGPKKAKKLSNTGSGVPLDEVIRFKYQKGFTQAVRLPCNKNDFTIF